MENTIQMGNSMKKVTTIVLNGFTNDSRVLKENLSLKKAGYDVEILALHKKGLEEFELIENIPVYRLNASKRNLPPRKNEEVTKEAIIAKKIIGEEKILEETNPIKSISRVSDNELLGEEKIYEKDFSGEKEVFYSNKITEEKKQDKVRRDILVSMENKSFLKKIVGELRKLRRKIIRAIKLFIGELRKRKRKIVNLKNKFLNKYFKLYRLKFNLLFAKRCKERDIVHCNDLLTLPMGVIAKKFYNKNLKIVYDAHEYETELNGLKGKKKRFRKLLEKSLIKYADRVMTVSNSIAEEYVRLYNIEKPVLVLNTPPYTDIVKKNIFRETFNIDEDKTIFLYQGGLVNGRGIEDILESFREIKDDKSVIVFMGYGVFEEEIQKHAAKYNNIFFHPAVSPDVLLEYTSSADFGISMIEDICLSYRYCLPNKMFEYMMAEVPVIVSNLPEMKKVVETYKVGVVAKSNGREGLEAAILEATKLDKQELNTNIKKAKKIFNWEEQEKVLLATYRDL